MKFNKHCKICRSYLGQALLYQHHCEHVPYLKLIELFEEQITCLNLYNVSTHFNRHVEQADIREVERLKAEYESN
jgi:hypothetical protein